MVNKPIINNENEKEVRACFSDDEQFELFRSGKDYSYGLASITDAEYKAHYDQMSSAAKRRIGERYYQWLKSIIKIR